MRKKIGLLISSLHGGGAERVVSRLSLILSKEFDIYIILFDSSKIKYDYRGKIIDLSVHANNKGTLSKVWLLIRRVYRLKKIKKSESLDVVISFLDSPNIVNLLSKNNDSKVILSVRNYIDTEKNRSTILKITNFFSRITYNKADLVIPVSEEIGALLNKKYLVDESKLRVIYNPYELEDINHLANENIEVKYQSFMHSNKIFISVGRQVYQKGLWHLVKAFKLVHEQEPTAKLVLIGKEDDTGKLEKLVNEMGLTNSILFTGFHNNPFKFIKNSQVYVMTSLFEGFPNSLVEAMGCGCPVISTDCKSGPKEILFKEYNFLDTAKEIIYGDYGIIVPPFKEGENWDPTHMESEEKIIAKAMLDLIRDKEKLKYYSMKSIERAKIFNYEKCFEEFKSVIDDI